MIGRIASEGNAPCTERDMMSRVLIITADSQHEASQSGVRHDVARQLPATRTDAVASARFSARTQHAEMAGLAGSRLLHLLVACYLAAIVVVIGLVGVFADGGPNIACASVGATTER